MPIKFESITYTTKDIVTILGGAVSLFTFYLSLDSRMDSFELKMQGIISTNDLNRVEFNAKIESLKHSNNKTKHVVHHTFFAICPDNKIEVKKRKLFSYKLV